MFLFIYFAFFWYTDVHYYSKVWSQDLFIFLEEASYVSHVFDLYILLQFKISVFYLNILSNVIYSCDGKVEFTAAITQVSHDPSEIILICCFDTQ